MTVILLVEMCAAFGLTVSEKKTGTIHMPEPHIAAWTLRNMVAGQDFSQTNDSVYLRGTATVDVGVLWLNSSAVFASPSTAPENTVWSCTTVRVRHSRSKLGCSSPKKSR